MKRTNLSKLLFTLGLFITLFTARAQYVAIPDSTFGNWLNVNGYSSCLIGNSTTGYQLDTSCNAVIWATSIDCDSSGIHDLTGLQYFRNLTTLNCRVNQLTGLPSLPTGLTFLDCCYNSITGLPALPSTLTYLYCYNNSLTSLPPLPDTLYALNFDTNQVSSIASIPSNCITLSCNSNRLTSLPPLPAHMGVANFSSNLLTSLPTLPTTAGLQLGIDCSYNPIGSLPALPNNLYIINCSGDGLTTIPALPSGLQYLECSDNLITSWSILPDSLVYFNCGNDNLTILPILPNSISGLYCYDNPLSVLPQLPASLTVLYCVNDGLSALPVLPQYLNTLTCDSNNILSLPSFPSTLYNLSCKANPQLSCLPKVTAPYHISQIYNTSVNLESFYIAGTAISCLYNRFTVDSLARDIDPSTMPLCTFSSGCPFADNIEGSVHNDLSATCAQDSLHPGNVMPNVNVQLIQNGQIVQQCYTDSAGAYSFTVDSLQGYTVLVDTSWLPFTVVCPASDSTYISLSHSDTAAVGINFGLQCTAIDYGVGVIWGSCFTPGDTTLVYVIAGNPLLYWFKADCGAGMSGTVVTVLSGPVQYAGPGPGALTPSSIAGDTILYTISDLDSLVFGSLDILVYTDSTATLGTDVCMLSAITSATPDAYPGDDSLSACFAVSSSFDPNHKAVSPTEGLSETGDWLTYTIEFQNTGTAPATTVVVRDTLSTLVQPQTFRYISSDHKATVQLVGNAMTFTFPHINLPDSASDPAMSKGWLQYKVRAKANLPLQAQIRNTAYIYFDYNAPVVTNTTVSTVGVNTGITSIRKNNISLYPNPNTGSFNLQTYGQTGDSYTITDMIGNVILKQRFTDQNQQINLPNVATGVYTILVQGAEPLRFVVVK